MDKNLFKNLPYIIDETEDFSVVFKPPGMHCAAADSSKKTFESKMTRNNDKRDTLFEWLKEKSSSVYDIMHRLDYETHGLVLFAKNEKSFNFFKDAQNNGNFIKEYSAKCAINNNNSQSSNHSKINKDSFNLAVKSINGFPASPLFDQKPSIDNPFIIESYFRPYGRGRKEVRPVIEDNKKYKEIAKDKGGFYKTEIISVSNNIFTARIKRGFRHQIRCHLFWIGFSILNDPLYQHDIFREKNLDNIKNDDESNPRCYLSLKSHAIFFPDPETGKQSEYRIQHLI